MESQFSTWYRQNLEKKFGLKRIDDHNTLANWLNIETPFELTDFERIALEKWQKGLRKGVDDWNEVELRDKFIAPLMRLIDFDTEQFSYFAERKLSAVVNDIQLGGAVDAMVATGHQFPEAPYFCFHEYKREGGGNDPAGQVLVAMLVAQTLNDNDFPIYGAYVIGRNWHFIILTEKIYSISLAYDATQKDVYDIFQILKKMKHNIIELTNQKID